MESRTLKTILEVDQSIAAAAESIGIAENTLRTLLRDDWDQLARETIEKICDRYSIGVADLFELVHCPFWDQIAASRTYSIIRDRRQRVQPLDASARSIITRHVGSRYSIRGEFKDDLEDPEEIIDFVKQNTCLIIGSARTNRATEVVVCKHFGAKPFCDDPAERAKIPLRFVFYPEGDQTTSTLAEPWTQTSSGSGVGIYDGEARRLLLEIDWLPREEFKRKTIERARDCALAFVVNKPFGTKRDVKLIVLAGLTGIGTEAAADSLVDDYRDLEPKPGKTEVLGVLEAAYTKTLPDEDNRKLIPGSCRWKYVTGGRKTVLPSYRAAKQ